MIPLGFHTGGRNGPDRGFQIDFRPGGQARRPHHRGMRQGWLTPDTSRPHRRSTGRRRRLSARQRSKQLRSAEPATPSWATGTRLPACPSSLQGPRPADSPARCCRCQHALDSSAHPISRFRLRLRCPYRPDDLDDILLMTYFEVTSSTGNTPMI